MNRAPLSPASALVAHIENLVDDRRILVVGNAQQSIAEHLLERGARLVQVLDPDPRRVAQAAANNSEPRVTYAQLTESALRDGSFDCSIVEDVSPIGDLPRLVAGVRRSTSQRGVAFFCASNPDASTGLLGCSRGTIDYDELFDAAEDNFESVHMLGQSPFLGYSVVHLGLEHPPEPALDNRYLSQEEETPDFYIAICGSEESIAELSLEEMTIVQLPAGRFVEDSEQIHRDRERRTARRAESLENELSALRRRGEAEEVEKLTLELERRDAWIRELESRAEAADARADDALTDIEELEKELEITHAAFLKERAQSEDLETLQSELDEARRAAAEGAHHIAGLEALEAELTTLDDKRAALETALGDKKRVQEKLENRLAEQEHEIDDLHDQLDGMEDRLGKSTKQLAASTGPTLKEVERDLRDLEDQLKERGRRVSELEGQLHKLETYAKTLSAELSLQQGEGQATNSDNSDRLEMSKLAQALAEREADLVAAEWTIGQLKRTSAKN